MRNKIFAYNKNVKIKKYIYKRNIIQFEYLLGLMNNFNIVIKISKY